MTDSTTPLQPTTPAAPAAGTQAAQPQPNRLHRFWGDDRDFTHPGGAPLSPPETTPVTPQPATPQAAPKPPAMPSPKV